MLHGIILSCAGLCVAGAPEAPPFAQIWYREVILGEVASAALQYEAVYLTPPSEDRPLDEKVRAAFRAAQCFERLGEPESAMLAYAWIRKRTRTSGGTSPGAARTVEIGSIGSEVALRMHILRDKNPGLAADPMIAALIEPAGGAADDPADASAGVAVRQVLDSLRDRESRLHESLLALESELGYRRERYAERSDLLARLARRGAVVPFPERASLVDGLVQERLRAILPATTDVGKLQSSLAERFVDRGLRSLAVGNWFGGRSDLAVAAVLLPGHSVVAAWQDRLRGVGTDGAELRSLARRASVDERLARISALRQEVRSLLESSEKLVADRGRTDLAIPLLARIREDLDWASPSLREDPEVRRLEERAYRWLEYAARTSGVGDALRRVLEENRESVESALALCEALVDVLSRQASVEGPVPSPPDRLLLAACRTEFEWLLQRARVALGRGDRLESQRWVRDASTLLEWVPDLNPRAEQRAALGLLRDGETAVPGTATGTGG